mmetsp:Transcript_32064/g.31785  ORF Transcript_32064/g.31785 Transcript_32064/m.31785 type:complete len:218 (-) Transcript_32064:35-688(-)|eukprot:CAMPEP_0202945072 /NCGR_PEP_ID=MMETSP1395-20130829/6039_1 /ASSEMBLY_ACC=CAM_ASM_000871 /TAXON_ID=5961 /ORGANISM="Blepharisma japonicum, Strain Stock R1072" /LENGTH=217 /DNA_ID=CAMNT_0049644691 /DNA_START=723 /DNA_END=1376 /DNA_ORIENTATION=+
MDSRRLELQQDIAELDKLISQSARQSVQARLLMFRAELQTELDSLAPPPPKVTTEEVKIDGPEPKDNLVYKPIERFAWDQEGKDVKIYVTSLGDLRGAKDKVTMTHTPESVDVKIVNLDGLNYRLRFPRLHKPIASCRISYKSSGFSLTMKKKEDGHWDSLEFKAPIVGKAAEKDPEEDSKDPGASLMKMMQDLYQNGDEDMKRTIAEAWSKAQEKK